MKTVILCGGQGTRIRDVAENIPKPMLTIGEYPILWHIMKYYSCFNFKEFILCLGYKGDVIRDYFINYEYQSTDFTLTLGEKKIDFHNNHPEVGWKITFAETGLNTMTGARVNKIKKYIGKDTDFMLTYGDGIGDINIKELVKFHKSHGKIITVTGVSPTSRFGELVINNDSVVGFNEKPQVDGGKINGGFFVCKREIFDYLNDNSNLILEQEPINNLVRDNQMKVFIHNGFWQPMDTMREYQLLNTLYLKNQSPWKIWN